MASEFLTNKQKLERRKIEIYQTPAYADKANPLHKSYVAEMENIRRELAKEGA